MGTLQKAFLKAAQGMPKTILSRIVTDKLQAAGIEADKKLVDALTDHMLSRSDKPFEWDQALPNVVITIDDDDIAKLNAEIKRVREKTPTVVEDLARTMTRKMLADYKKNWGAYQDYEQGAFEIFRLNLEDRWGKALNGLRILADFCREVGQRHLNRLMRSRSLRNRHLRAVLNGLHLRACQVVAEILILLENGFPDGAMARWRTLHELVIVASVVRDGGDQVAQRYSEHDVVEAHKAMLEYVRNHAALGYGPMPKREIKAITEDYESALLKHGRNFRNEYGWAAEMLKKASPRFADLEAAADLSAMRSYYKMASYNVHAGVRGLTQRIGNIDNPGQLIGGATNAGLEEPGIRTAMSLAALAILLMAKSNTIDGIVEVQTLADLRDQACAAFMRAMRRLHKDEMAIRKERAAKNAGKSSSQK